MTTEWQKLFSEVERVYTQIARLLQDADGLMANNGMTPYEGKEKTVGMQGGQLLEKPSFWFPGWVSRHYCGTGTSPLPMFHIAVLLCPRSGDNLPDLPEPVVTAAVWVYDADAKGTWHYWMAKAWGWDETRPLDGSVVTYRVDNFGVKATGHCFAVPISRISSVGELSDIVVEPLLALAKRVVGAGKEPHEGGEEPAISG